MIPTPMKTISRFAFHSNNYSHSFIQWTFLSIFSVCIPQSYVNIYMKKKQIKSQKKTKKTQSLVPPGPPSLSLPLSAWAHIGCLPAASLDIESSDFKQVSRLND